MSAEFESGVFTNGQPAWHGLGTVLPDEAINAERAIELAGLDWTVSKEPVIRKGVEVPGKHFTVRSSDDTVLGIVGDLYVPVQNAEAFDFMDSLLGDHGFHYVTAGSLRRGKTVWMLAKPDFKIDLPDSPIDPYVLLTNGHDGGGMVQAAVTPVRVVCMNTLRAALGNARATVKVRHTTNVRDRMGEAHKVLGLARGAADKLEATATALYKQKMSDRAMDALLKKLFPVADGAGERTVKSVERTRQTVRDIYEGAGLGQREIKGTAWGVFNAVVAYNDHAMGGRNTSKTNGAENRFDRIMTWTNVTDKAAKLLSVS